MNRVLTVFIDGLKAESLDHMPFLRSLSYRRRIRTELGYSNTCHASMYTGVFPNKHLIWFIWKYSPETSPYKWINQFKIDRLPNNVYSRYALHILSCVFTKEKSTAFFGIPFLWNMPLNQWHFFDVAEKKYWTEPKYVESHETIFEILTANKIEYDVVGLPKRFNLGSSITAGQQIANIRRFRPVDIKPWTYIFFGDIDPLSHFYGQDSPEVRSVLKDLDAALEQAYNYFASKFHDFTFLLFSDHGHIKVAQEINLYDLFKSSGDNLNDYIHLMDSNFIRFWFRNDIEKNRILQIMEGLGDKGRILNDRMFEEYNIEMPDNRYGDLIYYIEAPNILARGEVVVMGERKNPKYVSMHGYLPDHADSYGVLVSNKPVVNQDYLRLPDIMPSILSLLGVDCPIDTDGHLIWT